MARFWHHERGIGRGPLNFLLARDCATMSEI
jgi:hypothetical protein